MYSSLSTIAEVGIGLAGFAAVAVAIGYREGEHFTAKVGAPSEIS